MDAVHLVTEPAPLCGGADRGVGEHLQDRVRVAVAVRGEGLDMPRSGGEQVGGDRQGDTTRQPTSGLGLLLTMARTMQVEEADRGPGTA